MGQHYIHGDEETTEAGRLIYGAICDCRDQAIPNKKIIEALIAELQGMSYLINHDYNE